MPIDKAAALKALDEAFAESLKQGFAFYVGDVAGLSPGDGGDSKDQALGRFSRGVRLRIDCHGRAIAAINKIMK